MASPQMAGVLLPHSGSGHCQTMPDVLFQAMGQIRLPARAVAVRPAPLRPIVGPRGRAAGDKREHGNQDNDSRSNVAGVHGRQWIRQGYHSRQWKLAVPESAIALTAGFHRRLSWVTSPWQHIIRDGFTPETDEAANLFRLHTPA